MKFGLRVALAPLLLLLSLIVVSSVSWAQTSPGRIYVGLSSGYDWSSVDVVRSDPRVTSGFPDLAPGESFAFEPSGAFVGGTIGRDWVSGNWVFGALAEFNYSGSRVEDFGRYGYSDGNPEICPLGTACNMLDDDVYTIANPFAATIGGRVGYLFDKVLVFVGAGLSVGKLDVAVSDNNHDSNGGMNANSTGQGTNSSWATGYKLMPGIEVPIEKHMSFGVTYSFMSLGSDEYKLAGESTPFSGPTKPDINYRVKLDDYQSHQLAVELKYYFQ